MIFWIYMVIIDLIIPITMLWFGQLFIKKPPQDINTVFGYRTAMSMKNRETWNFAHKHLGKTWRLAGMIMIPISLIAMMFCMRESISLVGKVGGILCGVQLIILICSIIPTELSLKKYFDEFGNKR